MFVIYALAEDLLPTGLLQLNVSILHYSGYEWVVILTCVVLSQEKLIIVMTLRFILAPNRLCFDFVVRAFTF
jgi:hypothetical protein